MRLPLDPYTIATVRYFRIAPSYGAGADVAAYARTHTWQTIPLRQRKSSAFNGCTVQFPTCSASLRLSLAFFSPNTKGSSEGDTMIPFKEATSLWREGYISSVRAPFTIAIAVCQCIHHRFCDGIQNSSHLILRKSQDAPRPRENFYSSEPCFRILKQSQYA